MDHWSTSRYTIWAQRSSQGCGKQLVRTCGHNPDCSAHKGWRDLCLANPTGDGILEALWFEYVKYYRACKDLLPDQEAEEAVFYRFIGNEIKLALFAFGDAEKKVV